jgi:hypothetical protein
MININRLAQALPKGYHPTFEPTRNRITLVNDSMHNVLVRFTYHPLPATGGTPWAELTIGQANDENTSTIPMSSRTKESDILCFVGECAERYRHVSHLPKLAESIWLLWQEYQQPSQLSWAESQAAAAAVRYLVSNLGEDEMDMLSENTDGLLTHEHGLLRLEQRLLQHGVTVSKTVTFHQDDLDFIRSMDGVGNPMSALFTVLSRATEGAQAEQTLTLTLPVDVLPILGDAAGQFGDDAGILDHLNDLFNRA